MERLLLSPRRVVAALFAGFVSLPQTWSLSGGRLVLLPGCSRHAALCGPHVALWTNTSSIKAFNWSSEGCQTLKTRVLGSEWEGRECPVDAPAGLCCSAAGNGLKGAAGLNAADRFHPATSRTSGRSWTLVEIQRKQEGQQK